MTRVPFVNISNVRQSKTQKVKRILLTKLLYFDIRHFLQKTVELFILPDFLEKSLFSFQKEVPLFHLVEFLLHTVQLLANVLVGIDLVGSTNKVKGLLTLVKVVVEPGVGQRNKMRGK